MPTRLVWTIRVGRRILWFLSLLVTSMVRFRRRTMFMGFIRVPRLVGVVILLIRVWWFVAILVIRFRWRLLGEFIRTRVLRFLRRRKVLRVVYRCRLVLLVCCTRLRSSLTFVIDPPLLTIWYVRRSVAIGRSSRAFARMCRSLYRVWFRCRYRIVLFGNLRSRCRMWWCRVRLGRYRLITRGKMERSVNTLIFAIPRRRLFWKIWWRIPFGRKWSR